MITIDRLLYILEDWSKWMHKPSHKLGYPSKSLALSSSGTTSFEDMTDINDLHLVEIIDTAINDLPQDERDAICHKYLKTRKPLYYELKLDLALQDLLTKVSNKILV